MTTTPLATIAEALIEFILSLLRDPQLAADFEADPDKVLARAGLADICATDVRQVLPVVVDRPDVVVKPVPVIVPKPVPAKPVKDPEVVKHLQTVANNYHIDNRSTIVDQSVNQNIWAEGDVTQVFDQEAVIGVGDNSVAAGDNALLDNSTTDITVGDVAVGNEDTDVTVTDSFNDASTDVVAEVETEVEDSFNDESTTTTIETDVDDSFNESTAVEVDSYVEVEVDSYVEVEPQAEAEPLPETDYENS